MKNRDTFSSLHPIVNFLYFGLVLIFSMSVTHPICLFITFISALCYSVYLSGKKSVRFNVVYMLPLFILTSLVNPTFSHKGGTIIAYLPSGNPLTMESICYGMSTAVMIIAVINWFSCYNLIMTSDKFIYLFGRVIPSLSLVLSMTLCFVPKFEAQIKVVTNAQKCLGRDASNGNFLEKVKHGITILSIMVTWALENAIETADSMKSRGYGLSGRTAFSIYRFDKRDRTAMAHLLFCGIYIIMGVFAGAVKWRYYPTLQGGNSGLYSASVFLCYFALCLTPVIINIREDLKWKVIQYAD